MIKTELERELNIYIFFYLENFTQFSIENKNYTDIDVILYNFRTNFSDIIDGKHSILIYQRYQYTSLFVTVWAWVTRYNTNRVKIRAKFKFPSTSFTREASIPSLPRLIKRDVRNRVNFLAYN